MLAPMPLTPPDEGSAVVLFDRDGRILLQQRDDDTPPEGYGRWAIPGGGCEGDETPRETAVREFAEETGVHLSRVRHFRSFTPADRDSMRPRLLHVFLADDEVDPGAIEVNEGLDFRFWTPEEARALRMNPSGRFVLEAVLESEMYRGWVAWKQPNRRSVSTLEIDRWGRILLQLRDDDLPPDRYPGVWSLPGGLIDEGESPDAAALREFEEETGHLLEELKLYRSFHREELPESTVEVEHVYYIDADIPEEHIDVREGLAFRYWHPSEFASLDMPPHARHILEAFVTSGAYKAMFH